MCILCKVYDITPFYILFLCYQFIRAFVGFREYPITELFSTQSMALTKEPTRSMYYLEKQKNATCICSPYSPSSSASLLLEIGVQHTSILRQAQKVPLLHSTTYLFGAQPQVSVLEQEPQEAEPLVHLRAVRVAPVRQPAVPRDLALLCNGGMQIVNVELEQVVSWCLFDAQDSNQFCYSLFSVIINIMTDTEVNLLFGCDCETGI